ncbi:hypothetical protein EVAR_47972_1 [Eumeta japonica]|uniref:Uncharacterized protein n=1 Tax=Eumeta variegata TaxID=151549 RepID=A0A4C1X8B1_EUMVA|nr:hypothetical protein EVAR_47972_1 [Eumeta japonica]
MHKTKLVFNHVIYIFMTPTTGRYPRTFFYNWDSAPSHRPRAVTGNWTPADTVLSITEMMSMPDSCQCCLKESGLEDKVTTIDFCIFSKNYTDASPCQHRIEDQKGNGTLEEVANGRPLWHLPGRYCLDMMLASDGNASETTSRPVAAICNLGADTEDDNPILYAVYAAGMWTYRFLVLYHRI